MKVDSVECGRDSSLGVCGDLLITTSVVTDIGQLVAKLGSVTVTFSDSSQTRKTVVSSECPTPVTPTRDLRSKVAGRSTQGVRATLLECERCNFRKALRVSASKGMRSISALTAMDKSTDTLAWTCPRPYILYSINQITV